MTAAVEPSFFTCLQPFWTIYKILGLEVVTVDTRRRLNTKQSLPTIVYCAMAMLTRLVLYGAFIYVFLEVYKSNMNATCFISSFIKFNILFLSSLTIQAGVFLSTKTRTDILQQFVEVDQRLIENHRQVYSEWFKKSATIASLTSVACFVNCIHDIYSSTIKMDLNLVSFVAVYVTHITNLMSGGYYVNFVLLVRQRLSLLNERLRQSGNLGTTNVESRRVLAARLPEQNIRTLQCSALPLIQLEVSEDEATRHVTLLKVLYDKMYDVITLMNAVYGLQVLFSVLTVFVSVTYSFHSGLQRSAKQNGLAGTAGTWSLTYVVYMAAAVWASSVTSREARNTQDVVQGLLLRPGRTTRQLVEFSDHICSRDLTFSGAGFFHLDLPLVASLTGAVTSYILVLLQFDKAEQQA